MPEMNLQDLRNEVLSRLVIGSEVKIQTHTTRVKNEYQSRIEAFYPFYVLTINDLGFRECFSYRDIYNMLHGVALEERTEVL